MSADDSSRAKRPPRHPDEAASREARRFHRVPAAATATLSSSALGRVRVTVVDLSQGGCRIRTLARCHLGDRFVLRIDGTGPKAVTVIWQRGHESGQEIGLAFAEPLCWTVVAAIVFGGPEPRHAEVPNENEATLLPAKVEFGTANGRDSRRLPF